jgi:type I restriction enzyme S subunit
MKNWRNVKLGNHTSLISSGSTPRGGQSVYLESGPVMLIRSQNVRMNQLDLSDVAFISDEIDAEMQRSVVAEKDVLLNITGASIGRVATFDVPHARANVNQHVCIIRPNAGELDSRYLTYYLSSSRVQHDINNKHQHGGTRQALTFQQIAEFDIPLPYANDPERSLREQKRIAAILDKADAIRRKRRETLDLSKHLTESTFAYLFGDTWSNDRDWPLGTLEDLCDKIVDCPHSTPVYATSSTGYLCIRSSDIQDGKIDLASTREVSNEVYEERIMRHEPQPGEVVFTREGGRLGNAAQIPPHLSACLGQRMMLFNAKPKKSTNEFIWALLNSPGMQRQICYLTAGAAAPRINIADIRLFKSIVPPFDLQLAFTQSVAKVRDHEALARESSLESDRLFGSLVRRAFRGEL